MSKNRFAIVIVVAITAVVVVAGLSVTKPWTYFIDNEVNEAFPGLTAEQRDGIRDMSEEQQDILIEMADDNQEMAEQIAAEQLEEPVVVPEAEQAMPAEMPADPVILAVGSFIEIDAVHGAEGTGTIYELPAGNRILRLENFRSTNGPELHVILSREVPTTTLGGIGENYIDLGRLKGNVGNQNYDIPDSADVSEFQSVVIYCLPFRVVFSSAELE